MIQIQNKKYRMKSFKYVQFVIRRLCSELFYFDMPHPELSARFVSVENWIRCENALGRIDDDRVDEALDYAIFVIKSILHGKKKGDDYNAD